MNRAIFRVVAVTATMLSSALALGCGSEVESAEGGGTGGDGASSGTGQAEGPSSGATTSSGAGGSCALPTSVMPVGALTDPSGAPVGSVAGAVVESEGLVLAIDTCFAPDADCKPNVYTLTMTAGLEPTVPIGTLVEVSIAQAEPPRDADETASVRVTNQPQLEGVTNPTMTLETEWFLSSSAHTCEHPEVAVGKRSRCESDGVDSYAIAIDEGGDDVVIEEGEIVTEGVNPVLYSVGFFGGWTQGELGACRWQVRREQSTN